MSNTSKSTRKTGDPRLANLRPRPLWKPGETGNPRGGSAKARFRRKFREYIKDMDVQAVYDTLIKQAKRGKDYRFIAEVLDRVEGKVLVKQEVELHTIQNKACEEAYLRRLQKLKHGARRK